MKKYFVVANFACDDGCECDLSTSQWKVGSFDSIEDCMKAGQQDLVEVAKDHYECVLDYGEEFDSEEEFEQLMFNSVETYCENRWEATLDCIEIDLKNRGCAVFLTNDFIDSEFTDQRQVVSYCMYVMED